MVVSYIGALCLPSSVHVYIGVSAVQLPMIIIGSVEVNLVPRPHPQKEGKGYGDFGPFF